MADERLRRHLVVGGGATGENAADRAGRHGKRVALVEAERVGGECSYWACMPSKALLRPGDALGAARRVPGAREAITRGVDPAAAFARRDEIVHRFDDGSQVEWLEGVGVTLVRGRARFTGARRLEVEAADGGVRTLEAGDSVILATGSEPVIPPIDGLDGIAHWTSRDATSTHEVPRRLLVLGGGAVACELAQAMRWLGAEQVTVVQRSARLLSREEPFAGDELHAAFAADGIDVRCAVEVARVSRAAAADGARGEVVLELRPAAGTRGPAETLVGDELLVATGRRPRTAGLGLDAIGLDPEAPLAVDPQLRVQGVDGGWLYAVGDVNGLSLFTHMGKYQARLAGDHACGARGPGVVDRADGAAVPRVVFTDPQVAAVGLTEAVARDRGLDVRVVRVDLASVGGTTVSGEDVRGTAQLVIDESSRTLVGATFTGPAVGEMLHAATIAVVGAVTVDVLWHAVPAYPTVSEVWLRLLEAYGL